MSEKFDEDVLLQYIRKQNKDLVRENSECKILRIYPTKKNNKIYQAILQVDLSTYKNVINSGHMLAGLDMCTVYDALEVPRCYKCNNFNHSKKFCTNHVSCPLCSEHHDLNECSSNESQYKCSNCISIKQKQKTDIDVNHTVWDYNNCYAYKKAYDKFKIDLYGSQ